MTLGFLLALPAPAGRRVAARTPRGYPRGGRARPLLVIACCLVGLSLSASNSAAARDLGPLSDAPEWPRLVTLWHAMLDHSSNLIYSRARFDDLVKDLDQADADLSALTQRRLLSDQLARDLRRLFHARYQYIQRHHYTTQRRIEITETESAQGAADWVMELQLALLRTTYPDPDRNLRLISAAESNLSYELTFLYHLDKFEAEADRRRANLKASEDEGKTVDWQAFDTDCAGRYRLLLDAYRARRIPSAPAVRDLLPYVFALTQSRPPPPAATPDLPGPDI